MAMPHACMVTDLICKVSKTHTGTPRQQVHKRTTLFLNPLLLTGILTSQPGTSGLFQTIFLLFCVQDAVRGDHGEVATVLIQHGGKVIGKDGELVELADSPLSGNVRLFTGYDPEWEIDPSNLVLQEKIGGLRLLWRALFTTLSMSFW